MKLAAFNSGLPATGPQLAVDSSAAKPVAGMGNFLLWNCFSFNSSMEAKIAS